MSMDDKLPAALRQGSDSPFIPTSGHPLQFAWDSVSLTNFLSCPRRYQYTILDGYVSRNPNLAIALVFGIQFHSGLELYHKARFRGLDHDEAVLDSMRQILRHPATESLPTDAHIDQMAEEAREAEDEDDGINLRNSKIRTRYHLARALVWYFDHYGAADPCQTLALPSGAPAVEVSFRVPLPIEVGQGEAQVLLCGHIDRTVDYNGFLYNSDYKTAKSITSQWKEMFDLSHQMTGYTVAGNVIFDRSLSGILIDGVALQVGGVKFARHFSNRSRGQIGEYFDLLRDTMQRARHLALTAEHYPMNTAACYFCEFKSICRQPPELRASYIQQHFVKKPGWNPLDNR